MGRYLGAIANKDLLIRVQWTFIAVLATLALVAIACLASIQRDLTLHIPPDLRSGATLKPGEVPPASVYAFATTIWQMVNHWPTDGDADYGGAIFRMQYYVTPECRDWLKQDMATKSNNGELSSRTRGLQVMPGHEYAEHRVQVLSPSAWRVETDFELAETVKGVPVKDIGIRYPLRVVRYAVDPELNPFGLAVDCLNENEQPMRLDLVAERKAAAAAAASSPVAASGAAGQLQHQLTH